MFLFRVLQTFKLLLECDNFHSHLFDLSANFFYCGR